jgi:hypothetical protein
MKERTRNSFEMAHHHNLWRAKENTGGENIISCLAEAIRQHAFIWSVARCESLDDCIDDLELVVTALHAYKEGSLTLSSKSEVDMPLEGLFDTAAKNLSLRGKQR